MSNRHFLLIVGEILYKMSCLKETKSCFSLFLWWKLTTFVVENIAALIGSGNSSNYYEIPRQASLLNGGPRPSGSPLSQWITKRTSAQIMSFGVSSHHRCGFFIKGNGNLGWLPFLFSFNATSSSLELLHKKHPMNLFRFMGCFFYVESDFLKELVILT